MDKDLKKQLAKAKKVVKEDVKASKKTNKAADRAETRAIQREEQKQVEINRKNFEDDEQSKKSLIKDIIKKNDLETSTKLRNYPDKIFSDLLYLIPPDQAKRYLQQVEKKLDIEDYTTLILLETIKHSKTLRKNYKEILKKKYGSLNQLIDMEKQKFLKLSEGFSTKNEKKYFEQVLERMTRLKTPPILEKSKTQEEASHGKIKYYNPNTGETIDFSPIERRYEYNYIERCMDEYFFKSWLPNYSGIMYVKSNKGDLNKAFYIPESGIVINGQTFYQGTRSLDVAMCVGLKKEQNGENFIFETKNGNNYNLTIVYKMKDGSMIIQDEDLFKLEQDWIKNKDSSVFKKAEEILNTPLSLYEPTDIPRQLGIYELELFFDKDSAKYIEQKIYEETRDKLLKNYFNRIGGLVIFLDKNYMKKQATLFNSQLNKKLFNQSDIVSLTPKEILQDIYNNPNISESDINLLNKAIEQQLGIYVYQKGKKILSMQDPTIRIPTRPGQKKQVKLTLQDYPKDCINNPNDLGWNIVYYTENDKLYCWDLEKILERIREGQNTNPFSGKEFSEEFLNRMKKYSLEDVKKQMELDLFGEEENINNNIQLPSLANLIFNDINNKELNLIKEGYSKDFTCSYYEKYIAKNNSFEQKLNKTEEDKNIIKEYCNNYELWDSKTPEF
jgi:hypothetical protein